jgi:ribosomal protein L24E
MVRRSSTDTRPGSPALSRRNALKLAAFSCAALLACGKRDTAKAGAERCPNCGMKIDPGSAWTTELVLRDGGVLRFDAPRCAFASWRRGKVDAVALRAQEFYERQFEDGARLRFVPGSDVVGPMGPDVVPVGSERADKFLKDHGGTGALTVEQVTLEVLDALR